MRRMREFKQQQHQEQTQQSPNKSRINKVDDGEYIDYEEVD